MVKFTQCVASGASGTSGAFRKTGTRYSVSFPEPDIHIAERVDCENEINALETRHRHDLAVHLYSTFLLHQVNPLFPPPQWASWPLPTAHVTDPRITFDAEDFFHNKSVYISKTKGIMTFDDKVWQRRKPLAFMATLNKSAAKVKVDYKPRRILDSKTTLINELHFMLQRKTREIVRRRNSSEEMITLKENPQMMEVLATRLANRLGNVLQNVASSKPRNWRVRDEISKKYGKTWQDMVIASFCYDRFTARVNIESQRKLYLKMRIFFKNVPYEYVHDAEENDSLGDSPDESSDEASEINSQPMTETVVSENPEVQNRLSQNARNMEFKERMILGLMDQSVREKQLSWNKHDSPAFGVYSPTGDYLHGDRQKIFESAALDTNDLSA